MAAETRIVVPDLLARHSFGRFHLLVFALCCLAMLGDGFDLQMMGYIAPALTRGLALHPGALGSAFAAGGLGVLIGNLGFAPLGDRFGRKPMILGCMAFFGVASLATAMVQSLPALMAMRFITGLGLGGVLPNILALVAEYMPRRLKITLAGLVFLGFNIGAASVGPVAAFALGHGWGWQGVFITGGLLPLVVLPFIAWGLPKSLNVLAQREGAGRRIAATLRCLDRTLVLPADARFVSGERTEQGFPVVLLFRQGRAGLTLLLWTISFLNMMTFFFLISWLPTLVNNAGLPEGDAVVISSLYSVGGLAALFVVTPLCDRFNRFAVLASAYLIAAMAIVAIGLAGHAALGLGVAIFLAGMFTFGSQNATNAIAANSYPTAMRSTGSGWVLGIGRFGQIVGPLWGGWLLALQWRGPAILYAVAVPVTLAALAVLPMIGTPGARRPAAS